MRRTLFLFGFFIFIFATLLFAFSVSGVVKKSIYAKKIEANTVVADASEQQTIIGNMPKSAGEVLGIVTIFDDRAQSLEKFLQRYRSPLTPLAPYFIEVSDKYSLDYRLLPAIAMQESGGGKAIPDGSFNAWGYAITETQSLGFLSWEQAIDRVARGIKKDYIEKGLVTPEQIMTKYTPASLEKGGAWAKGVHFFMEQMQ